MNPTDVFKDQPITIPANLAFTIWSYIASKPSSETAMLTLNYQQVVGAQLKALEDAYAAANAATDPSVVTDVEPTAA